MQAVHVFVLDTLPGVEFTVTHDGESGWLAIDGRAADDSVTVGAGWNVVAQVP